MRGLIRKRPNSTSEPIATSNLKTRPVILSSASIKTRSLYPALAGVVQKKRTSKP
ncbi:uncharacterized protein METZ01_LOCUS382925, partial [marine metagenome]